jgi:phosphocarrier protein
MRFVSNGEDRPEAAPPITVNCDWISGAFKSQGEHGMISLPDPASLRRAEQTPLTRVVVVADPDGLHLRNCLAVASTVQRHQADVTIHGNGQVVDAASILGLMSLAASPGTELVLFAKGPTAGAALDAITQLFAGEPAEAH